MHASLLSVIISETLSCNDGCLSLLKTVTNCGKALMIKLLTSTADRNLKSSREEETVLMVQSEMKAVSQQLRHDYLVFMMSSKIKTISCPLRLQCLSSVIS